MAKVGSLTIGVRDGKGKVAWMSSDVGVVGLGMGVEDRNRKSIVLLSATLMELN